MTLWRNKIICAICKKKRFGMYFADVIAELGRYVYGVCKWLVIYVGINTSFILDIADE